MYIYMYTNIYISLYINIIHICTCIYFFFPSPTRPGLARRGQAWPCGLAWPSQAYPGRAWPSLARPSLASQAKQGLARPGQAWEKGCIYHAWKKLPVCLTAPYEVL